MRVGVQPYREPVRMTYYEAWFLNDIQKAPHEQTHPRDNAKQNRNTVLMSSSVSTTFPGALQPSLLVPLTISYCALVFQLHHRHGRSAAWLTRPSFKISHLIVTLQVIVVGLRATRHRGMRVSVSDKDSVLFVCKMLMSTCSPVMELTMLMGKMSSKRWAMLNPVSELWSHASLGTDLVSKSLSCVISLLMILNGFRFGGRIQKLFKLWCMIRVKMAIDVRLYNLFITNWTRYD